MIRIDPEPGARIRFLAKKAGEERYEHADLDVLFERLPGEDPEPYERLLGDALRGDQPALHPRERRSSRPGGSCSRCSTTRHRFKPTSRGPGARVEADSLIKGICEWYDPWLPTAEETR